MDDHTGRPWLNGETAVGGLLLLLGMVVLLGQALDLNLGQVVWPVFVIVPGLGLLGLGLAANGRLAAVLTSPPAAPGRSQPGWVAAWSLQCSSRSSSGSAGAGKRRLAGTCWRLC